MNEINEQTQSKQVGGFAAVPTTKVLAIGMLKALLTPEQRAEIMPHEVPDTVLLYMEGGIDQFFSRQDGKGPLFLLNAASTAAAQEMMNKLPLVKAGLLDFEFIELGPLRPLRLLLKKEDAAH